MSRKYINDKWCVRCGKTDPTPYLKKKVDVLKGDDPNWKNKTVLDIGCGNCRNCNFMRDCGFRNITGLDMAANVKPKYADVKLEQVTLGDDEFPVETNSIDILLANYVLMFLDIFEVGRVLKEVTRVVKIGGYMMVELYPAKDCWYPNKEKLESFQAELINVMEMRGWEVVHNVKEKFIIRKVNESD